VVQVGVAEVLCIGTLLASIINLFVLYRLATSFQIFRFQLLRRFTYSHGGKMVAALARYHFCALLVISWISLEANALVPSSINRGFVTRSKLSAGRSASVLYGNQDDANESYSEPRRRKRDM
jgi:hypothetical protein